MLKDTVSRTATRTVRNRARTFYLASLFLPGALRTDVHTLYAYYRLVDDLIDEPPAGISATEIHARLDSWDSILRGQSESGTALVVAARRLALKYRIPDTFLTMVLEGGRIDLSGVGMETFDDLIWYSELVAGSVGMAMACILGASDEAALLAARDLGIAMQLTNVLRDIDEDFARGRLYLPRKEMRRAGCTQDMLHRREITPEFRALLSFLSGNARELYSSGMSGIHLLPRRAQFSIQLSAILYARILDKIELQGFDVFQRRAHLGTVEKWIATVPTYVRHRRSRVAVDVH